METFENVAKKSRRKRIWKTVAISSVVSLVLLGLLGKGLAELTSGNGRDLQKQYEVMSEIYTTIRPLIFREHYVLIVLKTLME